MKVMTTTFLTVSMLMTTFGSSYANVLPERPIV